MVVSNSQPQQEDDPVYDVVIVVEKTANLVPYLEELKTAYLIPTLEHFNGGPPSPIDTGHDYNCTLYCLVTYTAGDSAPEMASECFYPTTSIHEFLQTFDNLQFIGGAGQSCSHLSEGLSTALQCLDEIKQLRYAGKPTHRHCILICNSPPYHIAAEESPDYKFNSEQLASMMGKRGVNLSIISPRKIPALQKLFNEACAGDTFHIASQAHYAVDPRHLVLLKGFQLQERSISPKSEDKKPFLTAAPSPVLMVDPLKAESNFKKPPTNQPGLQQSSPQHMQHNMQPSGPQMAQPSSMPLGMQQVFPNLQNAPQSKSLVQPTMTAPGNMQRMRQQQPQDPNLMMRQSNMMGMQSTGGMMNQHMSQGMNQQAMMVSQGPSNMMAHMPASGPQNPSVMQPQTVSTMQPGNTPNIGMLGQNMVQAGGQNQNMQNQNILQSGNSQNQGMMQANNTQNQGMMSAGNQGMMQGGIQNPNMIQTSISQGSNMMQSGNTQNPVSMMQPGVPQNSGMLQTGSGMGNLQQPQLQQQGQVSGSQNFQFGQQGGFIGDVQGQNPLGNVGPLPMVPGPNERRIIWSGTMEYQDRNMQSNNQRNVTFLLNCNVSVDVQDMDISTADWPPKLAIQLLPQPMLASLQQLCKNSRQVFFNFPNNNSNQNPTALQNLYTLMGHGFAGCVRFPVQSDTKIILLMYSAKKKSFIGLIPNDQMGIVQGIKNVVARYRQKQQGAMSGINASNSGPGMNNQVLPPGTNNAAAVSLGGPGMLQPQMPIAVNTVQQQVAQQSQQQTQQQPQQQQLQGQGQLQQTGAPARQSNLVNTCK